MHTIDHSALDIQPINWTGLPKRFMNPGELEVLVALMKRVEPRVVVEFGCNEGRTAKCLMRELLTIECYVGVDVEPGYVTSKLVQRREVPDRPGWMVNDDPLFHLLLRPHGSIDLHSEDLPPADAVFIDGDHGRDAVVNDTLLARSIVRSGGIIVWHDYHDLGTVDVRDVLDEFSAHGDNITHVSGTWLAFERIV